MNEIIKILMKRDGISKAEAKELLQSTIDEMNILIACGDYDLAEEIFMYDLGLEIDYIPLLPLSF